MPLQDLPEAGLPDRQRAPWPFVLRVAFRFTCAYLLVDALWGLIGLRSLTPWIARHVFSIDRHVSIAPNGSGDTTASYVELGAFLLLAAIAMIAWSLVDRRRGDYRRAHSWLRVFVRYSLALALMTYGFAKIFKTQFPDLAPSRLEQTYGESSPMGLLWTFMGYSTPYTVFGGLAEVLGAVLLFFPRTTTLGALVAAAVMTNIVMLNFSYDVPVKLYSMHLLGLSVLLLLPEIGRLARFFVLNRAVEPAELVSPTLSPRLRRTGIAVKLLVIVGTSWATIASNYSLSRSLSADARQSPLLGAYEVEEFTRDGAPSPQAVLWRTVTVGELDVIVMTLDGKRTTFRRLDEGGADSLTVTDDSGARHVLGVTRPDADHVVLEGTLGDEVLRARLRRRVDSGFLLIDRGFHWINEWPFNR